VRSTFLAGLVPAARENRTQPVTYLTFLNYQNNRAIRTIVPRTVSSARPEAPAPPCAGKPPRAGSPRVYAAGASPSPYVCRAPAHAPRPRKPPRAGSPRVYAVGALPSPYVAGTPARAPEAPACPEAPAFTRREPHLHPTSPAPSHAPGSPRVYAAGASPSPYVAGIPARAPEAPAFTRWERSFEVWARSLAM
jgi:hypothetical protein